MTGRYVLSLQAVDDLLEICGYLTQEASPTVAERVETTFREKFAFLAENPGAGHYRKDLTDQNVKFLTVYSYLVVYRPGTTPLEIVSILHGRRDIPPILGSRS